MDPRAANEPVPVPEDRAPVRAVSPAAWARENLLSTWYNALLTVVMAGVLGWVAWRGLRFVFVSARWEIIRVNLTTLLVGLFPRGELWRPWAALSASTLTVAYASGIARTLTTSPDDALRRARLRASAIRRVWPVLVLLAALLALRPSVRTAVGVGALGVAAVAGWWLGSRTPHRWIRWTRLLVVGGVVTVFGLLMARGGVGWDRWGGLLLTLFLTVAGILVSFPFGVLLALGRRSSLPAVKTFCVAFIELIRGVPLVTLLFMGVFSVGFLLPPGSSRPSAITRGLVMFVAFTSAYLAEIVRGGLQAVPRGQVEAAQAVGLSPVKIQRLIVLPQALRAVIPAIVGQFISLFKDTSLFVIIGGAELLSVAQSIASQGRFLGQQLQAETLLFAAFVYWVGSYTMSRESQRLERRLGVGER